MNTPFNVRRESWARLSALLDEAYELDSAARTALIAKISAEDADLGRELARLLTTMGMADATPAVASGVLFTSLLNDAFAQAALREAPNNSGLKFGGWTLTEKIGQGGMGEVWSAVRSDGMFQGTAAIKLLRSDLSAHTLAARFARERNVLARLNHPNIARLLDAGVANDQAYIVLERVHGLPLLAYAASRAPTVADRVRLIRDLTRAVAHAHSQLVLHRDLKPSNVMVTENGSAKLLDFGIAAALDDAVENETAPNLTLLTGRGLTLEYAAPEQIMGEPTVAGSDVYSLGAMLFHLLTGQRPFAETANRASLEYAAVHTEAPRASASVLSMQFPPKAFADVTAARPEAAPADDPAIAKTTPASVVVNDSLPPPSDTQKIKGDLDAIIAKALRKSPANRYAGASAFAADLDAWLAHTPISIRAEDRSYRSRLWFRRNWKLATLGGVAAAAVVVGLGVSLWQRGEAKSEAAKARAVSQFLVKLFESADPERTKGEKLTAREVLDAGAKTMAAQFVNEPDTLSEMQAVFGLSYLGLSQPLTAIPLLTNAAAAASRKFGSQSVEHARLLHSLARAQMEAENFPEAAKHALASMAVLERVDGLASEPVVEGKGILAYAYQKQGKFAEIAPVLEPVRAAVLRDLGDRHWLYAEIENSRAVAMSGQGRHREELEILASIEPLLLHPPPGKRSDALTIRANLAVAMTRNGKVVEAIPKMDAVIAELVDLLGPDAERTLKSQWFSAELLRQSGQYAACSDRYQRLAEQRARVSGELHPLTVDVFSKAAACAQLAGDEQKSGEFVTRALRALPAEDNPPQRTVLRVLLTLNMVQLDRGESSLVASRLGRTAMLATALNLAPEAAEAYWLVAVDACVAAGSGDFKSALRRIEPLSHVPGSPTAFGATLLNAYLLALDRQNIEAQAALTQARQLASPRFAAAHPVYQTVAYIDALIGAPDHADRDQQLTKAHSVLEANTGRKARLPLAPNWFAF